MYVLGVLLLSGVAAQDLPGLRSIEPRPPRQTRQIYEASCGNDRLIVKDFSALGAAPQVLLNGRRLRGERATALERDLSDIRSAYRLSVRCAPKGDEIMLEIHRGKRTAGKIKYEVGGATFFKGTIASYTPLTESNESTYWFS